ncbi:hypothetical protein ABGB14_44560 [Nonomuraea sp. B10E15]|uniref:hypothetical protein n=1 Tax=Nonomuraea sp. B10E15 TaxID=3153560 RepID=UPI00325F1DDD
MAVPYGPVARRERWRTSLVDRQSAGSLRALVQRVRWLLPRRALVEGGSRPISPAVERR